mmetsp:Transcript_28781/g.81055  ORF Transcript_28781/g.81055 Transcript_28781/m.81055 type:complete len:318 (+) Transcript_28781:180-1133(+)|eukprot:CAMPEP_0117673220 /NCGR_PEP_ID=MMETSP0804-20121206/14351_1 /TAXON_ID=1074897 /ORGANISM="Tetraselmis astigmatica, Strain CCMP880" /LENGTH=317 /DNA_ID=CAMNT_0005481933 /DNA_START=161 /DNA_END=1114 /DNA_ORIENTATION=+
MYSAQISAGLGKSCRQGASCKLHARHVHNPPATTPLRRSPASLVAAAATGSSGSSTGSEFPHRPHALRTPSARVSAAVFDDLATEMPAPVSNSSVTLNRPRPLGPELRQPGFSSIPAAVAAYGRGDMIVVLDDEDRENEGDLIMAAEHATAERLAFMVRYTSGVICVGMRGEDLDRLQIPLMVESKSNEDAMNTAFTVTVDLKEGTTTGISAADRAATLRALSDPKATPEMFNKPGHIFPLRCREGGVVQRPGHTEASVDLALLAGCKPAGVLCEIVNEDGTMARTPQLLEFGALHGLHVITIKDMVTYITTEKMLP